MARKPQADSRPGTLAATKQGRDGRSRSFPIANEADSEDVHWALSAAATMWESGDDVEALKWLRRAASTAADRDADLRALELFKMAADIASELDARSRSMAADAATELARKAQARRGGLGSDSTIVPRVPPEPEVTLAPRMRFAIRGEDSDEDTRIRPETMLRRALMAIDPDYARRTEYSPLEEAERNRRDASLSSNPGSTPPDSAHELRQPPFKGDDPEAATERRKSMPAHAERTDSTGAQVSTFPGMRVAVLPIPEERDVRLVFLGPGAAPPPGVAIALLVPQSEEDARRLAMIYAACDAKL